MQFERKLPEVWSALRRPVVPVVLLVAAVLLVGIYPADRDAVSAIRQGDALAAARQYSAALAAYDSAAHRRPGDPLPHLRQGAVYVAQDRYEEAWAAYLAAVRCGGMDAAALQGLAELYAARGSYAAAAETLEQVLARQPQQPGLWLQLGEYYVAAGSEDAARQAFVRALSFDLDPAQRQIAHDRLGALALSGEWNEAILHLEAVSGGPNAERALQAAYLAVALRSVQGTGAESAFSWARLGEAALRYGDLALARRSLERAVELAPEYASAHAYLGQALSMLGEDVRAAYHLERAIALAPEYPLPYYLIGMLDVRRGWLVTGRDRLLHAHDLDPANPAICAAVADTHLRADQVDYVAAERWLHAAVDRAPHDVYFHLLLAHFYVDYMIDPGLRGVAVASFAVQLEPKNVEALETLGWAYHLGGMSAAALEPLLQARDLAPDHARIYYRLGEVYQVLRQPLAARDAYRQAIELDWTGSIGRRAREALSG